MHRLLIMVKVFFTMILFIVLVFQLALIIIYQIVLVYCFQVMNIFYKGILHIVILLYITYINFTLLYPQMVIEVEQYIMILQAPAVVRPLLKVLKLDRLLEAKFDWV